MALGATIYRIKLELSDIDRSVYASLDFRVAQHPSEDENRLVARILAYALLYDEALEFGKGISDVDEPALWVKDLTGQLLHWVDIGTPTAERIHIASKKAKQVTIVCHKGEDALSREMTKRKVHKASEIEVLYLDPTFIAQLAKGLTRNAEWTFVHTDGELSITCGDDTFAGRVTRRELPQ
jgi:uncharacterized protein YaeQ